MSLGFNLSTGKKDDTSTRLKVHDIKRAKNETRKLETEGKKMEERLMELKLAMNREKEERERQGGGFWKKGQQGTLNNYAEEVLTKKKSKSAGKAKIKILKDKPLDLPERSNQPGTMAFIAQKGDVTLRDKPKGPKCGQCEERSAAVSCMQCSENYCAGCFAAFHLKGNLKKHRSVPLTATPRQCFASPRPNPMQTSSSYDYQEEEGAVVPHAPSSARKKDRNSPDGASGAYDSTLLSGDYNEAEQAASFQDALAAWRTGKAAGAERADRTSAHSQRAPPTPRGVPYSPVQTPTVNMDISTGTVDDKKEVEITFNTSSMSYADRLLLKKHRRTDVDTLFTPRGSDSSSSGTTPRATPRHSARRSPRSSARSARGAHSSMSIRIEEFDDQDFDGEERVDFRSLYETVKMVEGEPVQHKDPDTISIVELDDSESDITLEHGEKYKIQEEGQGESWSTDLQKQQREQSSINVKPPSSAKSSRRKSARKSTKSSQDGTVKVSQQFEDVSTSRSARNRETKSRIPSENDPEILGARLKNIESEIRKDEDSRSKPLVTFSEESISTPALNKKEKSNLSKQRPESSTNRPKSGQSRPRTGGVQSRPQSRTKTPQTERVPSRGSSRQGSRPTSRANSRIGSSRAASRADNPGLLTKGPSDALSQIARMTPTSDTYKGGDSLFMLGVQPAEQEERTLTPSKHKNKDEKIKVSYQLYNMAPRSWKPDFSISDSVPVDDVDQEEAEDERASSVMQYHAYSEQLVSDMTERLVSRFGELPLDEDAQSDRSSGGAYRSLGEEYRTFTPRSQSRNSSLHDSPIVSGRGTPVQVMKSQARDSIRDSGYSVNPTPRKTSRETPARVTPTPPSARSHRARTPRVTSSRAKMQTPRRSKTFHGEPERPVSRAIVMEGTDLSIFDNVGEDITQNQEDEETLDQLEWELASQSGRLTADGQVSRMEILHPQSDEDALGSSMESLRSLSRLGQDQGYDINSKLQKAELEDEEEEDSDDEGYVRNLM